MVALHPPLRDEHQVSVDGRHQPVVGPREHAAGEDHQQHCLGVSLVLVLVVMVVLVLVGVLARMVMVLEKMLVRVLDCW